VSARALRPRMRAAVMQPLTAMRDAARRAIRGVFADIDDTISTGGRVTAEAYAAMERLRRSGLLVVPVTGRPAGWCDHIARMWPVDAVVGENGAFYFRHAGGRLCRRYHEPPELRARHLDRLARIGEQIVAAVPGCAF